uniref:MitMem_reg domain-containing protein n=1 Tax=Panagrellus redivivus TaxID=6233 RepID=A0A7E4W0E8_PANRE
MFSTPYVVVETTVKEPTKYYLHKKGKMDFVEIPDELVEFGVQWKYADPQAIPLHVEPTTYLKTLVALHHILLVEKPNDMAAYRRKEVNGKTRLCPPFDPSVTTLTQDIHLVNILCAVARKMGLHYLAEYLEAVRGK